eukprot:7151207-Prymnesium_polylepis.1
MVPARRGPLHRTANCCRSTGVASHRPGFASPPIQRSRQRIGSESSNCIDKLHLTDNWYNVHTCANQRPEFSKRQAR